MKRKKKKKALVSQTRQKDEIIKQMRPLFFAVLIWFLTATHKLGF